MRVVLDVNVFVASVVASGTSAELVDRWRNEGDFDVVVCPGLLAELRSVLLRPKFSGVIPPDAVAILVDGISMRAVQVADPTGVAPKSRDPDDDYLIALAIESGADILVSGDKDLLDLDDAGVRIVSIAELLAELQGGDF